MKTNTNYSERNETTHAAIKWLKPQMQAVYARWENGDTKAYETWMELMDEENATEKQAKSLAAK